MRKLILIAVLLFSVSSIYAQRTGIRLKRLQKADNEGALIISGSDSYAAWSDDLAYLDGLLRNNTDTFATRSWVRNNLDGGIPFDLSPLSIPFFRNDSLINSLVSQSSDTEILVSGDFRTTGANVFESVLNDPTATKIAALNSSDELTYLDLDLVGPWQTVNTNEIIYNSGNVGIGVTDPLVDLHIQGQQILFTDTTGSSNVILSKDTSVFRNRVIIDTTLALRDRLILTNKDSGDVDITFINSGGGLDSKIEWWGPDFDQKWYIGTQSEDGPWMIYNWDRTEAAFQIYGSGSNSGEVAVRRKLGVGTSNPSNGHILDVQGRTRIQNGPLELSGLLGLYDVPNDETATKMLVLATDDVVSYRDLSVPWIFEGDYDTRTGLTINDTSSLNAYRSELYPSGLRMRSPNNANNWNLDISVLSGNDISYSTINSVDHEFYVNGVEKFRVSEDAAHAGFIRLTNTTSYADLYGAGAAYIAYSANSSEPDNYPFNQFGALIIAPRVNAGGGRDIVFAGRNSDDTDGLETKAVMDGLTGNFGFNIIDPLAKVHVGGTAIIDSTAYLKSVVEDTTSATKVAVISDQPGEVGRVYYKSMSEFEIVDYAKVSNANASITAYFGLKPEVSHLYQTALVDVGATSDVAYTFPTPSVTYLGKKVTIIPIDLSGTYGVTATAGTDLIWDGTGTITTMNITEATTLICMEYPSGGYYWFKSN